MNSSPTQQERDERLWALLVHIVPIFLSGTLGVLVPLAVMLIKPGGSEFVYHHAKQALIFQIAILVAIWVSALLIFVLVGFLLLPLVVILAFVGAIIAGVKGYNGEWYRYPIIGNLG